MPIRDGHQHLLWPGLFIVRLGRVGLPVASLMALVSGALSAARLRADDELPPDRLGSPASPDVVIAWLRSVWARLEATPRKALLSVRRELIREICDSRLSEDDRIPLLLGLDYLFRLVSARQAVCACETETALRMPSVVSATMQTVYRRLTQFAAMDLPVWLVGEKGTELARLSRLLADLRGTSHGACLTIRGLDAVRLEEALCGPPERPLAVICTDIDLAPEACQQELYARLMEDLGRAPSVVVTCTSHTEPGPSVTPPGMLPELAAFLAPTRIDVPPLRNRLDDLPGLMAAFAAGRNLKSPASRFSPEALNELSRYHWPGNVDELEQATAYVLQKRPSGTVRVEDLPGTVRSLTVHDSRMTDALREILEEDRFRSLRTDEGRQRLAQFLGEHGNEPFRAVALQACLSLGRETVRRLLIALERHGIIEGRTGAQGKRVTRYQVVESDPRKGVVPIGEPATKE